jgi:hypothetical protein
MDKLIKKRAGRPLSISELHSMYRDTEEIELIALEAIAVKINRLSKKRGVL